MTVRDEPPSLLDAGAEPTVALVVAHAENRQLLERWFDGEGFAVATPTAGLPDRFDLCVVDPPGYERHAERLDALRADSEAFLPYLLVADDRRALGDPGAWERVDDVMVAPIEPAELSARVSALVERRRTSERLVRSGRRFRALFKATPDPVFGLDDDGRVVDVNESFCRAFGAEREDCTGRPLGASDALPAGVVEDVEAALAGDDRAVSFVDADGEEWVTEIDVAREGDYRVVVLRDVTDQVSRRRELRRKNERLDEFASVLSHDLRNPINVAEGWLEEADESEPWHEPVTGALDQMRRLIDELLELSRQGEVLGSQSTVDLRDAAERAWSGVETGEATLEPPERGRTLTADRERLEEALGNLFRNAVEHGGEDVAVTVGWLDDGFYVADDGPGIPAEEREAVFDSGYTTAVGGTGFGLSIVEQIFAAHGWTVDVVESEAGGARFEVTDLTGGDPPEDVTTEETEGAPPEPDGPGLHHLQRLHALTTRTDLDHEEKVDRLLDLGRQRLGLPYGFLTHIEDGTQTVVAASGDHEELQVGAACPLSEAYCRETLDADGPLGVHDALEAGWGDDPAYERFDLGTYIGATVVVDGDSRGTLCFAATAPREEPFSESEKTFLRLAAAWVGRDIEREQRVAALEAGTERLTELTEVLDDDVRVSLAEAAAALADARDPGEDDLVAVAAALDRAEQEVDDALADGDDLPG